jgi:S1-C subfamily serine protease
MGMNLPPPIPGVPPPPPAGSPALPGRRTRVLWLIMIVMLALSAGVVGAFIGASIEDQTETAKQPSRQAIEVADAAESAGAMDVAAVLSAMEPSVVTISADTAEGGSTGTGVVLTSDGEILTNAHVVEGATEVRVRLFGEIEPRPAEVLAADDPNDLALLRIDVDGLTPAAFADPDSIAVGDQVIAIGYALNLDGDPSVTSGIVSALDRTLLGSDGALDGLLQTDAAISSGNSGGPLINARAEVVGINTAVYQSDATTAANNVGFAISAGEALPIIERLRGQAEGEDRLEGFLGVGINDRRDGGKGAIVSDVSDGSPAADAGFEVGDVVLEADGSSVNGSAGLIAIIRDASPGDTVSVTVVRDGERIELEAVLSERES